MKNRFFGLLLLFIIPTIAWGQEKEERQDAFESIQDMNRYIFQNSDLNRLTKGYFLDYNSNLSPSLKDSLFEIYNIERRMDADKLLAFLNLIEKSDINFNFSMDSILFPILDNYFANHLSNLVRIPLFIIDMELDYLNEDTYFQFTRWNSISPLPRIQENQLKKYHFSFSGLFVNDMVSNNSSLYWDDRTFISNTGKQIEEVIVTIDGKQYSIPKEYDFSLNEFYDEKSSLNYMDIEILFSDGSYSKNYSEFNIVGSDKLLQENEVFDKDGGSSWSWESLGGLNISHRIYGDDTYTHITLRKPDILFSVLWGCDNGVSGKRKLDKPFILVSGWGPHTDNFLINNAQGWPSTMEDFYYSVNKKGFVDSLVGSGYDVILAKFYPPNTSIIKNSEQLEELINIVNEEKFKNDSYQENVIAGYSAGAMCVRLTLERMEYKNMLNAHNPHHHCKLFVSFDGEHGGANIPLGLQHSVKYLKETYATLPYNLNLKLYTLNYILEAPLSRELMKYYHGSTGGANNPGQGPSIERHNYLQYYNWYNHPKNTQNPRYPAFTRNISISNGTSHRASNSDISTYYPYSNTYGDRIFQNAWKPSLLAKEELAVYLLGRQDGLVFKDIYKTVFGDWQVRYEKVTKNAVSWDNAPGGTTFLANPDGCSDQNITYQVLDRLRVHANVIPYSVFGVLVSDFIDLKAMYSFTPTLLTHDIRNFDSTQTAYKPYYDMREEGLMYQNIEDAIDQINKSSFFGYPHLAHPLDHYSNYTPFDAVFAWDAENSVHIQSGHANWNEGGKSSCYPTATDVLAFEDPRHPRWEETGHISINLQAKMRSFILGEADTYNAYIQNRHYGWNANDEFQYRADIVSKHNIYAGDSVTQRTNFKPVLIEDNAIIRFVACKSIEIKPGFHAKQGSSFHAMIDTENCLYCGYNGLNPQTTNGHNRTQLENERSNNEQNESLDLISKVKLYPNPGQKRTILEIIDDNTSNFSYIVYDLAGIEVKKEDVFESKKTILTLEKGVYIIKVKINDSWHTQKLIMY
ncbi:MAG: T9SS type A sorting domain-containing protein [Brumimicrobium sp.]|nr:T9SS type A sorting domain-containing protein [Brumimicrobium sp.]